MWCLITYIEKSLKSLTPKKKGTVTRRKVGPRSEAFSNWKSILRINQNKKELIKCLLKEALTKSYHSFKIIFTYDNFAVKNIGCNLSHISPFTNEEVDAFDFSHTNESVLKQSVDTKNVIIIIKNFRELKETLKH